MKINWYPGHMKKSLEALENQIKQVDAIIYVLDARCPKACINPSFAAIANRKKVVYYYSKRDLAPDGIVPNVNVVCELEKMFKNKIGFVKAMVIGVPNVGKSTLINKLSRRKKTVTGNKPGVTKTTQWVNAGDRLWLMDTPGVLMPNMEDQRAAKNLAYIGTIKDEVFDIVELAGELVRELDLKREVTDERTAKAVLVDFRAGKLGKFNLDNLL